MDSLFALIGRIGLPLPSAVLSNSSALGWAAGAAALLIGLAGFAALMALRRLPPNILRLDLQRLQAAVTALESEVSLRRSAEQHIRELEQSLAMTLTSIDAGFIATDVEGKVTRMNAVAEHTTGWVQAQALGQSLWQVFDREGRPPELLNNSVVGVMLEKGIKVADAHHMIVVSRDGHRTAVQMRSALTYADDGSVRGLVMVFRDMSALEASEAENRRLAAIVASSNDAIIGKWLDGTITSWNRGAEQMFGYSAAQIVGQPVQRLIPAEKQAEEDRILAAIALGAVVPPFETERLARDGSRVPVSVTISPILDLSGQIIGTSKIVRDIRAQLQAKQSRLQAEQLASEIKHVLEANRLKSLFLANMSHELRTPLNAIIGFAELLLSGAVSANSPKYLQFLGHIGTSGHHLLQLINDVLDLSKVESGKFDFYPEPIDLPLVVQGCLDVLHGSLLRKGQTVTVAIDPALGGLVVDPARLKQALYNYLSNAIKFTPDGGHITLRASPAGPLHFRIEVEDTGIGIAPADLPRLFSEFQQLDTGHNKQHAGTGLGLALTRRLVAAQGGSAGVRSQLGKGSVFDLLLPRRPLPAGSDLAPASPHWLVIENAAGQGAQVVQALADQGIAADTADSAAAALQCSRDRHHDAIALALQLPDKNGLAALGDLRRQGAGQAAPVLAMTVTTEPGLNATFVMADVWQKPLHAAQVQQAIDQLDQPPQRALVVDDDPQALDLMHRTLQGLGLQAPGVQNARQALQQIDQCRPDLIVLDLVMPDLDGFAMLDALRQMPRWRDTPVFIWTSMTLTHHDYGRLARSANVILHKGGGALTDLSDALCRRAAMHLPARSADPMRRAQ